MDLHDSNLYWTTSIKDTIKRFPFLAIMEHTANILKPNKGLIPSLLNIFAGFEFFFIDYRDKEEAISIRCIHCKKETV